MHILCEEEQLGQILGSSFLALFSITGGARQGCVLSPRLFNAVLGWAMLEWRNAMREKKFEFKQRLWQMTCFMVC
jgi:hypothetical protein